MEKRKKEPVRKQVLKSVNDKMSVDLKTGTIHFQK